MACGAALSDYKHDKYYRVLTNHAHVTPIYQRYITQVIHCSDCNFNYFIFIYLSVSANIRNIIWTYFLIVNICLFINTCAINLSQQEWVNHILTDIMFWKHFIMTNFNDWLYCFVDGWVLRTDRSTWIHTSIINLCCI